MQEKTFFRESEVTFSDIGGGEQTSNSTMNISISVRTLRITEIGGGEQPTVRNFTQEGTYLIKQFSVQLVEN